MAYLIEDAPPEIQRLRDAAERLGYGDFWYHPDSGLYGTAPESTIEDDRVEITWQWLAATEQHANELLAGHEEGQTR